MLSARYLGWFLKQKAQFPNTRKEPESFIGSITTSGLKKNSRYRNCTPSNGIGNGDGNGNGNGNANTNANANANINASSNGSGKVLIFCRNIPFL